MNDPETVTPPDDPWTGPPCLAILGPTATGKSALGVILAKRLGGEIVNGDALQVYRELEVGTAKPSAAERAMVPHHLFDFLDVDEAWSAGEFSRRARPVVREIAGRGRVPIVVGGSGLYLRALFEGLTVVPKVEQRVRERVAARCEQEGLAVLYRELIEHDPETASRLEAGDTQRILRATEVLAQSGVAISEWHRRHPSGPPLPVLRIGLTLPRAVLYDAISLRIERMLSEGWLDEVRRVLDRYPRGARGRGAQTSSSLGVPGPMLDAQAVPVSFQAIGYRELAMHVRGEIDLARAVSETVKATRRYAKRQETWFRRERDITWFDSRTASSAALRIANLFSSLARGGS